MSAPNTTNSTLGASPKSVSSQAGLLARHPLISFYLLAFALTWLGWSPWYLSRAGVGLLSFDGTPYSTLTNVFGLILGPTLSAIVVTGVTEGREGVGRLLRRIVLWRVGLRWYAFAFVVLPMVVFLSAAIMPGALAAFDVSKVPPALVKFVLLGFVALFIGGPVFEEIGWRGFALPRLQGMYGPLFGSLVLGVLWGLWHLPLFLIPAWDTPHGSPLDIAWFVLLAASIAVVFTWLFNSTGGSVLLTILAHGSLNVSILTAYDMFPIPAVTRGFANFVVGIGVLALLILLLTRGRLGYQSGQDRVR